MIMRLMNAIIRKILEPLEEPKYRKFVSHYNINGYKRVYFVHIRKTGGTSINHMFFSLACEDPTLFYTALSQKRTNRLSCRDKVFVGWNVSLINSGNYFYAFSHEPIYRLNLPRDTFIFAVFRDPVKRVISHYNMLLEYSAQTPACRPQWYEKEASWLGNTFDEFVSNLPKKHLLNQLYMFSNSYDVQEAVDRATKLNLYFFTEQFSAGITRINSLTNLNLKPIHIRQSRINEPIRDESVARVRMLLDKEYVFLSRLTK